MKGRLLTIALVLGALECAQPAMAQGRRAGRAPGARFGSAVGDTGLSRAEMQQRLRQATARITRQRLGLDDAQMRQLGPVNRKYETQRRTLAAKEQNTRQELRREMQNAAGPDQEKIAQGMEHLIELQRRRVDLLEAEQKELAQFLTPLQRVKYHALQEQIRRRAEQLRQPPAPPPGRNSDPFGTAPDSVRKRPPSS